MKVAASLQSINRAMPEGGIQVTSHQSLVTPNPQSLATHPCFQTSGLARGAGHPLIVCERGSAGSIGSKGVVQHISSS